MSRQFILVQFDTDSKVYLFETPKGSYIHFGTKLKLEGTDDIGTACCDYFDVEESKLNELYKQFNTAEDKMKKVVGYYNFYEIK